jgi:hypothetical protein
MELLEIQIPVMFKKKIKVQGDMTFAQILENLLRKDPKKYVLACRENTLGYGIDFPPEQRIQVFLDQRREAKGKFEYVLFMKKKTRNTKFK